jgi:hypothetical protein
VRCYLTITLVLLLSWPGAASCRQRENTGISTDQTLTATDSVYTLNISRPSFRQSLKEEQAVHQKKFVKVTAKEITNPALVAIAFDLYQLSGGRATFLGSAAPFPADNPGSFIIATGGRLETNGILELRLNIPEDWNKKDKLEVKISKLTLE